MTSPESVSPVAQAVDPLEWTDEQWVAFFESGAMPVRSSAPQYRIDETLPVTDPSFKERLQAAQRAWLPTLQTSGVSYLFEVLTFRWLRSRAIRTDEAIEAFWEYRRRRDRKVLGRAHGRGAESPKVIAYLEGGEGPYDKTLHLHLLSEIPPSFDAQSFAELSERTWTGLAWASRDQNRFEFCSDLKMGLGYISKLGSKPRFEDSLITAV